MDVIIPQEVEILAEELLAAMHAFARSLQIRKHWSDSALNKNEEKHLKQLGFHENEDHVFVGTAIHTDKIIVTEDSDYGVHGEEEAKKVNIYMRDHMKLSVHTSRQFLDIWMEKFKKKNPV